MYLVKSEFVLVIWWQDVFLKLRNKQKIAMRHPVVEILLLSRFTSAKWQTGWGRKNDNSCWHNVILGWFPVFILREIFAMMKLISSKVKFFYIRARFLNGRMSIFTGILITILKWSVVVRHGNSLSHKLKKFPYLILSPLRNPIFSKLFDKKSKKEGRN